MDGRLSRLSDRHRWLSSLPTLQSASGASPYRLFLTSGRSGCDGAPGVGRPRVSWVPTLKLSRGCVG
eukprot:scaffold270_cov347-Pavlova_lutheri.AAC.18